MGTIMLKVVYIIIGYKIGWRIGEKVEKFNDQVVDYIRQLRNEHSHSSNEARV